MAPTPGRMEGRTRWWAASNAADNSGDMRSERLKQKDTLKTLAKPVQNAVAILMRIRVMEHEATSSLIFCGRQTLQAVVFSQPVETRRR